MRVAQGGTRLYCPCCEDIRVCKAISTTYVVPESGQRYSRTDHVDIHWFRRGRECMTCTHVFLTAELSEDFVNELVELRDALADIKANAEAFASESAAAGLSLKKLSKSLSVLRALETYKKV